MVVCYVFVVLIIRICGCLLLTYRPAFFLSTLRAMVNVIELLNLWAISWTPPFMLVNLCGILIPKLTCVSILVRNFGLWGFLSILSLQLCFACSLCNEGFNKLSYHEFRTWQACSDVELYVQS